MNFIGRLYLEVLLPTTLTNDNKNIPRMYTKIWKQASLQRLIYRQGEEGYDHRPNIL